jgi:hypothetical protein
METGGAWSLIVTAPGGSVNQKTIFDFFARVISE